MRFKNHGLAPKSAADFAFLLHGFHFLKDEGVMAIILPLGVLFRGGAEKRIRTKPLKDGHIDTVIGLPSNLFYPRNRSWTRPSGLRCAAMARRGPQRCPVESRGFAIPQAGCSAARSGA